jgi:hypothetical protein
MLFEILIQAVLLAFMTLAVFGYALFFTDFLRQVARERDVTSPVPAPAE